MIGVQPTKAHVFERTTFRFGAERTGIAAAMGFTDRMTASCQRRRLLIVHRHAGKGDTNMLGCAGRVRITVHTFRVHVDQTHMDSGEVRAERFGIFEVRVAILRRGEPFFLFAPVHIDFWRPDIFAAKAEAEGFQTRRLIGDIAREQHQVRPGHRVSVFLLDRPEQATGLVQITIIRPAIERRKAQIPCAAAPATINGAIRPRRVPGHAHHQARICAPVGGPPVLAVMHQRMQIGFERVYIEGLKRFVIIKVWVHWVRPSIMLV